MIGELAFELDRRVERIVLHDDRTQAQDRVEGHDVLRAVGKHDRDRFARGHPELPQPGGGSGDLHLQIPIARRAPEELQRGSIGVGARRSGDDVHERARDLRQVLRNSFGVAVDPRTRRVVGR